MSKQVLNHYIATLILHRRIIWKLWTTCISNQTWIYTFVENYMTVHAARVNKRERGAIFNNKNTNKLFFKRLKSMFYVNIIEVLHFDRSICYLLQSNVFTRLNKEWILTIDWSKADPQTSWLPFHWCQGTKNTLRMTRFQIKDKANILWDTLVCTLLIIPA